MQKRGRVPHDGRGIGVYTALNYAMDENRMGFRYLLVTTGLSKLHLAPA